MTQTRTAHKKGVRIWSRKPQAQGEQNMLANVLCFPLYDGGGAFMTKAQWLGLLYGGIAVLGAAYGVFEHPHAINSLADSMKELTVHIKEILPFSLLLMLALMVYGLVRATGSVLQRLNGISLAAHSILQTNYGRAGRQTV